MSNSKITIPRVGDAKLLKCFEAAASNYDAMNFSVEVPSLGRAINLMSAEERPLIDRLIETNGTSITQASLHLPGLNFKYVRDGIRPGIFDHIEVSPHDPQKGAKNLSREQRLEVQEFVMSELDATDPARFAAAADADAMAQYTAQQHSILNKLVEAHASQSKRLAEHQEELQNQYAVRLKDLEKEFSDKRTELDSWQQDQELELRKEQEEFRKKKAELDDRNNTHVRRELRKELQSAITKRTQKFRLSDDTRKLRKPIHLVVCSATAVTLYFLHHFSSGLLESISNGQPSTTVLVVFILRALLGFFALAGLVWFYIRWLGRTYDEAAQSETVLRQLQLDIDRASWAVEAAFEWQAKAGAPMPDELQRSITAGLFEGHKSTNTDEQTSAGDQLASAILGSSARVKLLGNGSELEINKPSKLMKEKIAS